MRRCSSQSEYDWMKVRLTAWRWKAASAVASPPAWVPVRWTRWMVGVAPPRHYRYARQGCLCYACAWNISARLVVEAEERHRLVRAARRAGHLGTLGEHEVGEPVPRAAAHLVRARLRLRLGVVVRVGVSQFVPLWAPC